MPFLWSIFTVVVGSGLGLDISDRRHAPPVEAAQTQPGGDARSAAVLARACQRRADALRNELGPSCRFCVAPPFVVGGDLRTEALRAHTHEVVRHAAEAMWKHYFSKRPTDPITILLFESGENYQACARRLYGDDKVPHFGYYRPVGRTLLMNISTGGGTLVHELTHTLIEYDFPGVPDWFNEGLASLHEQCDTEAWKRGELVGRTNWRLPELQKAIESGRLRPLRELLTAEDFRGPQETLNYAQARYLCMYLQEQGVLGRLYKSFRDGYKEDPTGLSYVEDVLGARRIESIERDFLNWVRALQYRP